MTPIRELTNTSENNILNKENNYCRHHDVQLEHPQLVPDSHVNGLTVTLAA